MHVNGARDPVATGRAVAHAIQRARANALHGGLILVSHIRLLKRATKKADA
ncbi:hypothetical protein [Bartonella doshiae]|uniref:hypothetical protein n=1 Tax=Bartonella doshiae TaxID=33044 RepID=UPI0002F15B00|nr:hypothetical protein [Bartonella doshiae]MBB6160170.1 hypothetical protein [Bartonella doshiae]